MITCVRTNSQNPDFQQLVTQLDAYLTIVDGIEHDFYAQYNKLDKINHVVIAYENEKPVGCGGMKEFPPAAMEVKRMFVPMEMRGKGIASIVLAELEAWAKELNYKSCVLETGKRMPEAIALYKKNDYQIIPNFGPYKHVGNSVCFEKKL